MFRYGFLVLALVFGLSACVETTIARAKLTPVGEPALPLLQFDGEFSKNLKQFDDFRAAIQENIYGYLPDSSKVEVLAKKVLDKSALSGKAQLEEWRIEVEASFGDNLSLPASNRAQFNLVVLIPTEPKQPVPVIMIQTFCPSHVTIPLAGVSSSKSWSGCKDKGFRTDIVTYLFGRYIATPPLEAIIDQGFAIAAMYPSEVFPDNLEQGQTALKRMSSGHIDDDTRWGSIAAWGWLYTQIRDALDNDVRFDKKRTIAYGHSRYGKSALLAAAFDDEIDGVISHQSGTGGASLSRGNLGETIAKITKSYPYWFANKFSDYAGNEDQLNLDQHQLLALIAPRPLFLGNARRDVWSDPNGAFRAAQAASSAWKFFGQTGLQQKKLNEFKPNADIAFWIRPGTHGVTKEDWPAFLEFLQAHFGKSAQPQFDLTNASISDVLRLQQNGAVSCRNIIATALMRIAKYDKSTGLNAITVTNQQALQRADELDQKRESTSELLPLHCVPVLVKDNFDTHDMPTTGGSIALANSIPPDDAFMVRKLRQAGAIIVAKTNMAEWAFSPRESISSSYGRTANAYDLSRVPAGSSGGTASGLAAGFAVAGLGSDTGNSIRGPSSHLSLVGIRSTFGLTSRDGVIPLAGDRDVAGPMARSVSDVAAMFNVLVGYDPKDPATLVGKDKSESDYREFLDAGSLRGAKIGVLREWVDHENADPQITKLFMQALSDMQAQGAIIIDPLVIPNIKNHLAANTFCPSFRYDMANYLKTLGDYAPIKDVAEVLQTKQYGADAKGGLEFFAGFPADTPPEQWDEPCQRFWSNPQRQNYRKDVIAAMNAAELDILVYPTWSNPPAHIDRGRAEYLGDNSQNLAPNTGLPAMTIPMGFSHDKWPVGITMIARPFDEKTLFSLGFSYEQTSKHHRPPAGFD